MLRNALVASCLAALLAPTASAQWIVGAYNDLLGVDDAEFTPDGRYLVARDNTFFTTAQVYDAATGARLFSYAPAQGGMSGVCQDGVAVTDERAVVIGTTGMIIDLTTMTLLAEHDLGFEPRDLAVTPDGSLVAVRGGDQLYLIELVGGTIVATSVGKPAEYEGTLGYDVDSVVASDAHAVFTSEVLVGSARWTRVKVFDLHPSGGGPPVVVFKTDAQSDQEGKPNDVALTPDGRYAAVRSDMEVGLYRLDGSLSTQVWKMRLKGDPGPFGASVMDSIEVTDNRFATISRRTNAGTGAQIDVFTPAGAHKYAFLSGDPHDLAITPNGSRVLVRTHTAVTLFNLRDLPPQEFLVPLAEDSLLGITTAWNAGLDSIVATDRLVAATSQKSSSETKLRIYDIENDALDKLLATSHDDKPSDLAFSPDGSKLIFGFLKSFLVIDTRTLHVSLDEIGSLLAGWPSWCDGVAIDGRHAAAFGAGYVNTEGWLRMVDLFEQPVRYCPTNANSTGVAAELVVSGTPSTARNDLVLWGAHVPPGMFGRFFYGDAMTQVPFGDGFTCVAGQVARFAVVQSGGDGVISFPVDYANLPPNGGAILPGTTWNFQLVYRDTGSSTATFNLTDALSITFES